MTSERFGEVWLTVDEVVALGRSERRVLMNIAGENPKWRSRPVPRVGPHGRPTREVALSSLPDDLQAKYAARQRAEIITPDLTEAVITDTPVPAVNANDLRLVEVLKPYPANVREAMLTEARRRADIVRRYDALPKKRKRSENGFQISDSKFKSSSRVDCAVGLGGHSEATTHDTGSGQGSSSAAGFDFVPEVYALCEEARCTNRTIVDYYKSRQHSIRQGNEPRITKAISPVTLDGWSRRMKTEGLMVFLPPPPNRANGSKQTAEGRNDKRLADISPAVAEWINSEFRSKRHPTALALFQALEKKARRHGWKIPSRAWVYRKWNNLPAICKVKTKKAYVDNFAPYYPRDYRDIEALQILCGDHSQRDVSVRLPDGSLTRPWLTSWQDFLISLLWGWHLDLKPSSRTIGLAYANGVRTFGAQPPSQPDKEFFSYVYTDRGKDYKGHTIAGKTIDYGKAAAIEGGFGFLIDQRRIGMVDELGLKQIFARGYNAREKPVERTHRDISTWEAKTFPDEYCGADAKARPDRWRENYARHEHLVAKVKRSGNTRWLDDSPFMTLEDYREALTGYFFEYNHGAHQRSTLGGVTVVPIEEYQRLYTTRFEISEKTLAMLLMKGDTRVPRKNGVSVNGFQYLHPALAYYKGMNVEVRWSDDDYRKVFIFPPPTDAIPHPDILEADAVIRGGVLNPNRETQKMVARQRKFEEKVIRDHSLINQSLIRGESVEDRVAAQLELEEVEAVEAVAVAGGGFTTSAIGTPREMLAQGPREAAPATPPSARIHLVGRGDRRRVPSAPAIRPITVDEVSSAPIDESIFADESEESQQSGNLVRMWEDEN